MLNIRTTRNISVALLFVAAVGLIGLLVYATAADAQVRRTGAGGTPLRLAEVRISGSEEAMAILDADSGVLLVVRWDSLSSRPIAIGARDLATDFSNVGMRNYSMEAAASSNREDLLYVTDNDNRRLRIYRIDERRSSVVPITDALPLRRDGR